MYCYRAFSTKENDFHQDKASNGSNTLFSNHSQGYNSKKDTKWKFVKWGAISALVVGIASVINLLEPIITQKLLVSIELDELDETFNWVMNWLAQHPYTSQCTNLSVLSRGQYHRGIDGFFNALFQMTFGMDSNKEDLDDVHDSELQRETPVLFIPGPGRHYLTHKGYLMWIDYYKENSRESSHSDSSSGRGQVRNLTLTILNTNLFGNKAKNVERRNLITEIITEARAKYFAQKEDKTTIFCPDRNCDRWEEVVRKNKRPLSSVILPDPDILAELLNDVKQFISSRSFYDSRGIPYRRGYLLYGPPGSGKTSTVQAISGELGYDIYMINVSSAQMTDEKLNYLLHQAPRRSIVLLEDIDSCVSATNARKLLDTEEEEEEQFHQGSYGAPQREEKVTVSGLLNAIDGVGAQEGRILFFTTNHVSRLQRALLRPGRIDMKQEIGYTTPNQAKELFLSFYRDETQRHNVNIEELANEFTNQFKQLAIGVTPAMLQGLFMLHKNYPSHAIENLHNYMAENAFQTNWE